MNIYVPAKGNPSARLVVLGEAPSYEEEHQLTPFVGNSGRELDKLFLETGIKRSDVWMTNVSKYMVPPNPKFGKKIPFDVRCRNAGIDIQQQIEHLRNELHQLPNVNCILALGGSALWALTGIRPKNRKGKDDNPDQQYGGITDYRGSIMMGLGKKFVATYHPAHLLHMSEEVSGYYQREIMKLDFKRALKQSEFPEIRRPDRTLSVCRSSHQLEDFLNRYKDYKHPAADIESGFNCIPNCIGLAFTPKEGLTIPLWHESEVVSIHPSDHARMIIMLARFLANNGIIGQNFKYDEDKINRLGLIIKYLFSDTMLKAFAIHPELPKNLAFNTSIYTEEPFYKNEGMYEGSQTDLFIGCARDSCVTKEVDLKMDAPLDHLGMRDYYQNFIMKLHKLYLGIETEGFYVDENRRYTLLQKYIEWEERLRYERFKINGNEDVNPNSWKQVRKFLFEKLNCPVRESTGEEQLTSLWNQVKNENQRQAIDNILTARRVAKTRATYLMSAPDFDGRMKTTYYMCLETGRTSTGQLDPPIRPDIEYRDEKNKLKHKSFGLAFQTMTKHGDIGQDIRSMLIPDKGYCLLNIDSSQAEARVIFKLANDDEALALIDTCDYHALTASWFVGGTEDDWSKKKHGYETPERFLGKTLRHAGHLGAKGRRAMLEVNTSIRKFKIKMEPISERFATDALRVFHAKQPKIQKVFQAGVIHCIENNRRQLRAAIPYGIEASHAPVRTFFERYGDELFRQAFSYIPQRAVSDNTKCAALRIKKEIPDARIVVESHDALTFIVPINDIRYYVPILRREMERPIDFSKCSLPRTPLVIPSEIEIGENYQELSKYKELSA